MKKLIGLLVIAQFICLSQSAQTKRASDACPGANNKSSTSNDYAYLSKRTSGDSDFSKPKYQSIYAKNTNSSTPTKRGRAVAKEERIIATKPVHLPAGQAGSEKQTAPIVKEEKSNPVKTVTEPKEEDEFVQETSSDKKVETTKQTDVVEAEKANNSESNPLTKEEGKTASSKKAEKATSKNVSTKATDMKTTKTVKQKQQKKSTVKKLRLGKKCATDCPEF